MQNEFTYTNLSKITEGGFASIYTANCTIKTETCNIVDHVCALKMIPLKKKLTFFECLFSKCSASQEPVEEEVALEEVSILMKLQDNPFILKYYHSTIEKGKLILVTEFCSNRDLSEILEYSSVLPTHQYRLNSTETTPYFHCDVVRFVCAPVFDALSFIHDNNFIHRDVKPQNILVDSKGVPKLCDFGLTIALENSDELNPSESVKIGSSYYTAPELIALAPYGISADTWELAITMLTLIYGWGPYHFKKKVNWNKNSSSICSFFKLSINCDIDERPTVEDQIRKFLGIDDESVDERIDHKDWLDMKAFLCKMLRINVHDRPSCQELALDSFVSDPLEEWRHMSFVNFENDWKKWLSILKAC